MKYKKIITLTILGSLSLSLNGCLNSGLVADNSYTRTKVGAGLGAVAGGLIAYKTSKGKKGSKRRVNALLGALGGGVLGGGAGYALDVQANKIARALGTGVDNDPLAKIDPKKELIVSKTNTYVKIMFRNAQMFESGSSTLNSNTRNNIIKVGELLKAYPKTLVVIGGHTDNRGSATLNNRLSEQRAKSFADALSQSGIHNEQSLLGCSFSSPLVKNNTASNRSLNRRVEIFLYNDRNQIKSPCN